MPGTGHLCRPREERATHGQLAVGGTTAGGQCVDRRFPPGLSADYYLYRDAIRILQIHEHGRMIWVFDLLRRK